MKAGVRGLCTGGDGGSGGGALSTWRTPGWGGKAGGRRGSPGAGQRGAHGCAARWDFPRICFLCKFAAERKGRGCPWVGLFRPLGSWSSEVEGGSWGGRGGALSARAWRSLTHPGCSGGSPKVSSGRGCGLWGVIGAGSASDPASVLRPPAAAGPLQSPTLARRRAGSLCAARSDPAMAIPPPLLSLCVALAHLAGARGEAPQISHPPKPSPWGPSASARTWGLTPLPAPRGRGAA